MTQRLCDVRLDEASLPVSSSEAEQDRRVAIFDLLEGNHFSLVSEPNGGC